MRASIISILAVLVMGLLSGTTARAQSEESEPAPALGEFEAAPLPPPEKPFLVPDVPQSFADQTQVKERWFTLKPGAAAVFDYTAFTQDAASLSQVGRQADQWQVRDLRLMLRGTIGTDYSYARRVMPEGSWGAPELVARFSHEDLNDGAVQGGRFDKTYLGINWWATRRWKVGFGWGHTWLDRFDKTGVMDIFLTRLQWVY